jgi:hypothetical protein
MEHSIHVSAGHFIRGVGPTSSQNIRKKVKAADMSDMDSDGEDARSDDDGNGDDNNNALEFDAGDAVGKALALVAQVSGTPTRMLYCSNTGLADSNVPTGPRVLPTEV